jgi:hypothetical protein
MTVVSEHAGELYEMWYLIAICFFILATGQGGCSPNNKNSKHSSVTEKRQETMERHRVGRFAVRLPESMSRSGENYKIRFSEVEEVNWEGSRDIREVRDSLWGQKLSDIQQLKPPTGQEQIVIEERSISRNGVKLDGVLYYGFDYTEKLLAWEALLTKRSSALWIRKEFSEDYTEEVVDHLVEIASSYHSPPVSENAWFYLEEGAIALPYLEQESAYASFEGHPLDLTLELEMKSTDEVSEVGLLDRIAAAVGENFAPGVNTEKIRTGTRTVAGLEGEEAILKVSEDTDSTLSFSWMYPGREDSGTHPKILLKMESSVDEEDEKINIWDQVLDSMEAVGR